MAVSSSSTSVVGELVENSDASADGSAEHLKEFYIAIGVVAVFGSVIASLSVVVACTCIKYRTMLKGNCDCL